MSFVNCEFCSQRFNILENNFFCDKCEKLNSIIKSINYFDYLKLDAKLPIDITLLENNYIKLLAFYHSDNFISKSSKEQLNSMLHSSYLNNAYLCLKDDLKSIKYLYFVLFKEDILDDNQVVQNNKKNSTNFFFELNEELDNINNNKNKEEFFCKINNFYNKVMKEITEIFNDKNKCKMIKKLYTELLYIKRIKDRI